MSTVNALEFCADLWGTIMDCNTNVVISPLSIQTAFSMVLIGAKSKTMTELKKCLHIDKDIPADKWQQTFSELVDSFKHCESVSVHLANQIFLQQEFSLESEFTSTVKKYFHADIEKVNFSDAGASAKTINTWVEKQTNEKIKDLISSSSLSTETRLVLVNAIYFKGEWKNKFEICDSFEREFHLLNKSTKNVTMMTKENRLVGLDDTTGPSKSKIVQLPFMKDQFSLVVVLPMENEFYSVRHSLNGDMIQHIMGSLKSQLVRLMLPRFKVESSFVLNDVMKSLGVNSLFDFENCDLSGISTASKLFVSEAVHKAFLSIDEEGAEAAAATAVLFLESCALFSPEPELIMIVDRPFFAWIWDAKKQIPLFMSQVLNP